MTNRARNIVVRQIEADIEKCREESNWSRAVELAEQLKEKSPNQECLANFLIGEGKLEKYLEQNPPVEANAAKAKLGLMEAKKFLQLAVNRKDGIDMDAHLLLGKLHYACGLYSESLKDFSMVDMQSLSIQPLQLRNLRTMAESYAIKGLCLEQESPASSKYKQSEREKETIRCLEQASDLALLYMQELGKMSQQQQQTQSMVVGGGGPHSPQPSATATVAGAPQEQGPGLILELALARAPQLHLRAGRLAEALDRYRACLVAVEASGTHQVRLKALLALAKLLLQRASGDSYTAPSSAIASIKSDWKPKIYQDLNQFVPRNECEEALLALLIAEATTVRDAVLSQSPEFKDERIRAHRGATAVHDLLAVAGVRWGQAALLQESLERAMKFSFEEGHTWEQFALSLAAAGRPRHAVDAMKEAARLRTGPAVPCLVAARICFEQLGKPLEGLAWAEAAKSREQQRPQGLLGRCWLFEGIGHQLAARAIADRPLRAKHEARALDALQRAIQLEPADHLCHHYLALQQALGSKPAEAVQHVRAALALRPDGAASLQLFALLLSAQKQHAEALQLIRLALEEHPDSLSLLHAKAHLELLVDGGEVALVTAKHMMSLWKTAYEGKCSSTASSSAAAPECDRRSPSHPPPPSQSERDSNSLRAPSRIEQALSEAPTNSSMGGLGQRPVGLQRPWLALLDLWLLMAELYLSLGQSNDVQQSLQEAAQIMPLSHQVMHVRGLLHAHLDQWNEARLCFQNAVAVDPQHVRSVQQLGLAYHRSGQHRLAETTLRDAAKIDPTDHATWFNLGRVLEALGEHEEASECMANALAAEKTAPVLPYTTVPLSFE